MSEIQIQAECFQWLWNSYPHTRGLFFHVPNELPSDSNFILAFVRKHVGNPHWMNALVKSIKNRVLAFINRRKASGVVAGIPDCIFIQPHTGKSFGFEFKTDKGSVSPAQQKIHDTWTSAGITVHITRSLEEFKNQITPLL